MGIINTKQKAVRTGCGYQESLKKLNKLLKKGYWVKEKTFVPQDDDKYAYIEYILEKEEI